MKRYIIIGGVAGGATAAARLRRLSADSEIVLVERGEYVSFAGCGLPYYVGEVIQARESLLVMTPEKLRANFGIDVRIRTEAVAVDTEKKTVKLRANGTDETLSYDALLLSPGARAVRPPIPGIESRRIHLLRTVPDADALHHALAEKGKRGVVVGGGFIGVETAEGLSARGVKVTLAEAADHILQPFDDDMVPMLEKTLRENGIVLRLGNGVAKFTEQETGIAVTLQDGSTVEADFVVLAIGIAPDTAFLEGSGIKRNARGFIVVDSTMQTSVPDVYAVGDAVETQDFATGKPASLALAGPANRQGRIAADNMAGRRDTYGGVQYTSIVKVFSKTAAATGKNERMLAREGLTYGKDYKIALLHPFSHVKYYPGARQMVVKLLFATDGLVLGAQIIGADGVKARIDAIATAIRFHAKTSDLVNLELAYAPPFGAPKDPVNLAGCIAENIRAGLVSFVRVRDLEKELQAGARVPDVREPAELLAGRIEGAVNIPLGTLRTHYTTLSKDTPWIVLCRVGQRAYNAARFLTQQGYNARVLMGGILSYQMEQETQGDTGGSPSGEANGKLSGTGGEIGNGAAENIPQSAEKEAQGAAKIVKCVNIPSLSCPGPILTLQKLVERLAPGEAVEVTATDEGFYEDSLAWCRSTGNRLLLREKNDASVRVQVEKRAPLSVAEATTAPAATGPRDKTILVFSGDLDKALAAFIIANGAAATGAHVTMFFTFWGLSVLRRENAPKVEKSFPARLFSAMLPKGAKKLALSKFHMLGMGTGMMKRIMKANNVMPLEALIESAQAAGVEMIACKMTMDLMGIEKEELIDGVTIGGVASFLERAEKSAMTLRF